jgi:FixJ family two-component response regulator
MAAERSVVMIVDDDRSIRRATYRLTKYFGLAVEIFGAADEFLNSGRIVVTACLVLDVHLPGLSCLELQEQLSVSGYRIPIIL